MGGGKKRRAVSYAAKRKKKGGGYHIMRKHPSSPYGKRELGQREKNALDIGKEKGERKFIY